MARIEWVKHRLDNWALWHARGKDAGLGYATQSILLSDPSDRGREAWVPVDEIEAAVTEEGVEALKLGHGHLHVTLHLIYLKGCGIKEAARTMRRAESTISAQLARADELLAQFFLERKRVKEEKAKALRDALEKARPAKLRVELQELLPPKPRKKPPRQVLRLKTPARG